VSKNIAILPSVDGEVEETLICSRENLPEFLKEVNWHAEKGIMLDAENRPIKCAVCNKPLRLDDFGAFLKGSLEAVCGDFACFAGAIFYSDIRKTSK